MIINGYNNKKLNPHKSGCAIAKIKEPNKNEKSILREGLSSLLRKNNEMADAISNMDKKVIMLSAPNMSKKDVNETEATLMVSPVNIERNVNSLGAASPEPKFLSRNPEM